MKFKNFLDRAATVFKSCASQDQCEAILIEKPVDLFYLTGLSFSSGTMVISRKKTRLFVDGRYIELASRKSPFKTELNTTEKLASYLSNFSSIGFDPDSMTYSRWEFWKKTTSSKLIPLQSPTLYLRSLKSREELKCLKASAELNWKGYEHVRRRLKTGITEKEIAFEFEMFCRKHGAERMAFEPIVAFGANSAYPHHRASNTRLKKGDIVLLDLGVVVNHYCSDMTRTFFHGKPHPQLLALDNAVKEAHAVALARCKPGAKVEELDQAVLDVFHHRGFSHLVAHSLGHGVGLEIHELPRLKQPKDHPPITLKENMVITIEPGLYLPGIGGVRFEDTVVITKKGYTNWYA